MKLKYNSKLHRYWYNGKPCKSPSTIAKLPEDPTTLDKWRRRQTAIGFALQPHLLTAVAAAANDKQQLEQICEQAMDAAGAHSGRDYGTSVHRITELIDGGDFVLDTPEVIAIRTVWRELLDQHQLVIEATEQVILHPELKIAGRFDRVVRHIPTGHRYILDTKTGALANRYLHSHAIQLWLYASAPLRAEGPSGDSDFEIDRFEPMWPVRQDVALVAHLPQDGEASIIAVDIAAGARCFHDVIQPTWAWRNRDDLEIHDWANPQTPDRTANLIERLQTITRISPAAAAAIRANWPTNIPPLTRGGHLEHQLDQLDRLVSHYEDAVDAPFNPTAQPAPATTAKPEPEQSRLTPPSPGGDIDEQTHQQLRSRYMALPAHHRRAISGYVATSDHYGPVYSFNVRRTRSLRAHRIVDGLVTLAEHSALDEPLVVAFCQTANPTSQLHRTDPPAAHLANLGHTCAGGFQIYTQKMAAGNLPLSIEPDGSYRIVDPGLSLDEIRQQLNATIA